MQGAREEWQQVFYIAAGVYTLGAILFGFLAEGEEQPWAKYIKPTSSESLQKDKDDAVEKSHL